MIYCGKGYWKIFSLFSKILFKDADKLFDLSRGFVFLDKELAELSPDQDITHPKFVDKLVKVFTKKKELKNGF